LNTYRYSHEKNCGGQLSEKPVKPHTNPKPKAKQSAKPKPKQVPKPQPEIYYSDDYDSESDDVPQQPLVKKKQAIQPSNPLLDITNSYALLQQQLIQQKQQKYNKVCASIFAPRSKKRQ
jgi:outer membrane biosynthesis protein TonB